MYFFWGGGGSGLGVPPRALTQFEHWIKAKGRQEEYLQMHVNFSLKLLSWLFVIKKEKKRKEWEREMPNKKKFFRAQYNVDIILM